MQIGMGGAYHTWSPMFPDEGGLLINTCDLKLDASTKDRTKDGWELVADNETDSGKDKDKEKQPLRIVLHKRVGIGKCHP